MNLDAGGDIGVRAGSENLGSRENWSFCPSAAEDRRDHDETNAQSDPEVVSIFRQTKNCLAQHFRHCHYRSG